MPSFTGLFNRTALLSVINAVELPMCQGIVACREITSVNTLICLESIFGVSGFENGSIAVHRTDATSEIPQN